MSRRKREKTRFIITLYRGDCIMSSLDTPREVLALIHDALADVGLRFKAEFKKKRHAFHAKLKGYPLLANNSGSAVVGELVDRLSAEGWNIEQICDGAGLSIFVNGKLSKSEREPFRRSHSLCLALSSDWIYASGFDDQQLGDLQAGLVEQGMTVQKAFQGVRKVAGVSRAKWRGFPFADTRQRAHCVPAVLSALGALGVVVEHVAMPWVLARLYDDEIHAPPILAWGGVSLAGDRCTLSANIDQHAHDRIRSLLADEASLRIKSVVKGGEKKHGYGTFQDKFKGFPFLPTASSAAVAALASGAVGMPFFMTMAGQLTLVPVSPKSRKNRNLFRPARRTPVFAFMYSDTIYVSGGASDRVLNAIIRWMGNAGYDLQRQKFQRKTETHTLKFKGYAFTHNNHHSARVEMWRGAQRDGFDVRHTDVSWVVGSGDNKKTVSGYGMLLVRGGGGGSEALSSADATSDDATSDDATSGDATSDDATSSATSCSSSCPSTDAPSSSS